MDKFYWRLRMYCPHCGIEILQNYSHCPICRQELAQTKEELKPLLYPMYSPSGKTKGVSRRYGVAGIVFLVLLVPALVSGITDLILTGGFTWSVLVVLSLGLVAGVSFLGIILYRFPVVAVSASFFLGAGYFLLMNWHLGGYAWAVSLATPITLTLWILVLAYWQFLLRYSPSGPVSIGVSLILVSVFLLIIEGLINRYLVLGGYQLPGKGWHGMLWSPIVAGVLLPLGGMFFIIHWIIMKSERARKFFHW